MNLPVGADDTPLAYPDTPDDALSMVIPAAGFGERLGLGPKALLSVDGVLVAQWVANHAGGLAAGAAAFRRALGPSS